MGLERLPASYVTKSVTPTAPNSKNDLDLPTVLASPVSSALGSTHQLCQEVHRGGMVRQEPHRALPAILLLLRTSWEPWDPIAIIIIAG
jgi:hypothetical protein